MSITISPNSASQAAAKPKKNIFGTAANVGLTNETERKGVLAHSKASDGLMSGVQRVATGSWYKGSEDLPKILESYTMGISGDHIYYNSGPDGKSGYSGANFGFLSHLARRLPAPILFDDENIANYIFGENKPTAAVDTSGRMWMHAGFLEECLQEEARDKIMVMPLILHEYLHIALNHTKRMHNFPAMISNIAKDKVINPMAAKMFSSSSQYQFSDIFKLAHGNAPEDKKYEGMAEETIAKLMMNERRQALENLGTIKIKNLIIEDGPVSKITKLKAGKGETKEYDTVYVKVEDMGMMDRVDTEFECATLEIENIDNRLKTRKRNGSGPKQENKERGPIEIPTQSDDPSSGSDSDGNSEGKDNDQDPSRKTLDDIKKDIQAKSQKDAGKAGDPSKSDQGDASSGKADTADTGDKADKGEQAGAGQQGQSGDEPGQGDAQGQGNGQEQAGQPGQSGSQNSAGKGKPSGQSEGQGQGQGSAGEAGGEPSDGADSDQKNGSGAHASSTVDTLSKASSNPGKARQDPQGGTKVGDADATGVSGKGFKGSPQDALKGLVNDNPMNSDGGHEVDLSQLGEWLKANGHEELVSKMRSDDFDPDSVDRAVEVALKEAEKERLLIGSGYAGGHVEDYMHTVVRPNSVYKVNWMRAALDFLQGSGSGVTSTLDEYGIYTYISPEDLGFSADDGIYYSGSIAQKPEGAYFVVLDTSGSIWGDKKRMGHMVALALGIRATQDELSPDVWIVGADTVVSGKPQFYDEDQIHEAVESGVPLGGGGGTDYTTPINQVMAWSKENDVKPLGILYLGDFEVSPPLRENLPDDLPPVFFLGMPHDIVRADSFINSVSTWADVYTIEDDITIDAISAKEKADLNKHRGFSAEP